MDASYNPHDREQPDSLSQFTCAFVDEFTLEHMILHGTHDGMAADTSWRNKSENRAAVTFLIAVDENEHLVPSRFGIGQGISAHMRPLKTGSVLLSANVQTKTLQVYLEETKVKVHERARAIVSGETILYVDASNLVAEWRDHRSRIHFA